MNSTLKMIKVLRNYITRFVSEGFSPQPRMPDMCLNGYMPLGPIAATRDGLRELIGDGFLWAVPKRRRSLERRMTRRMGYGKMLLPHKNIIVCEACGHFHKIHTICGFCYEKVREETKVIQEAIVKEWEHKPVDQETIVLYEDDTKDNNVFEGKRILELPKVRPPWFSKNLLAKDSEQPRQRTTAVSEKTFSPQVENIKSD